MPASFIQIPIALIDYVKLRKLSGIQYTLWLYLYKLDPFGDRYVPIPSPNAIAAELGSSARTIQRAAQRLADLDLFDFNVGSWAAKNTTINKRSAKNSAKPNGQFCRQPDKNVASRTKVSKVRQNDPNAKVESSQGKHPSSSQTITDLDQTLSYKAAREEKLDLDRQPFAEVDRDLSVDLWVEDSIDNSTLAEDKFLTEGTTSADVELNVKKIDDEVVTAEIINLNSHSGIDNSSSAIELKSIAQSLPSFALEDPFLKPRSKKPNPFNWLPAGPWNIEGKLDPNFRDWLAKEWMHRYGGTIHQKRADVLSHFRKDPANLAIRWEQYNSEHLHRYENTKVRLANGIAIDNLEQKQLIDNHAALSRPLPEEMSPVANNVSSSIAKPKLERIKELSPLKDNNPNLVLQCSDNLRDKATNLPLKQKEASTIESNAGFRNGGIFDGQNSTVDGQNSTVDGQNSTIDWRNLPDGEKRPDNVDAYREWQPEGLEDAADAKQVQELFKSLGKKFGSMPKVPKEQIEAANGLEKLNSWLLDEILYPVALQRAKSEGYKIEYSCEGVAIYISEPEF